MINFFVITGILFSFIADASEETLEKVSLQLNWKYQFEFAGYIAAKEKGFYKDVGLDVELIEYQNGVDLLDNVLTQKSNYGVSDYGIFIRDKKIVPVKLLATYFQKSPLVLLTSKEIKSPNDLLGKTIMMPKLQLENSAAALLFAHFYLNDKNTNFIAPSFDLDDFVEHKTDAIFAYISNEPFALTRRNVEFNVIDPADYGYISPVGNLFTSPSEAQENPERTQKFLDASSKGWRYALAHQEEVIAIILSKYSKHKTVEALEYEASEMIKLMQADTVNVGTINQQARLDFVKQLKRSGLVQDDQQLKGDIDKDEIFTRQELLYLQAKKEIKMCIDPNWMPFEGVMSGQHVGVTADIIAHFQKKIPIPISFVDTGSWNESLEKVKNRECDILSLAISTPSRREYLDFTSPTINVPYVLATKNDTFFIGDIAEVKSKKLGIVTGNAVAEVLRLSHPDINIVNVSSVYDGLARVESGELFGYIDNLMVVANAIQRDFTGILKVSSRLKNDFSAGIATRNDEPQLHEVFEVLVKEMGDETLQPIFNKWIAVEQDLPFNYKLLWQLLAVMFVISTAFFYYYLRLKKLNEKLLVLSITDSLTGVYNRAKIDEVILHKKAILDRYGTDFSLILLDIDFFKAVNDQYGHIVGDHVLVEFAEIIKNNVRVSDYVGRWGGEEFLIICPNIGIESARELAEKLLQRIRTYSFHSVGNMTASAGVNQFSQSDSTETTLQNVDKALYQSKDNGRDRVMVYKG